MKRFAWTGTEDAAPVVHTKSNLCKTIFKIGLQQHFELIDLGHPDKFIDTIWKNNGKTLILSDHSSLLWGISRYDKGMCGLTAVNRKNQLNDSYEESLSFCL